MKKKISRIWGIGFVIGLAASLLLSAAPVSAGDLGWNEFKLPSDATTSNVILNADALTDYAVDFAVASDGTLYAVDGQNIWVYKSTDAGKTWSRKKPANLVAAASAPILVAVAPDDPDLVAIVLANDFAFASTDGMAKCSDLGLTLAGAAVANPRALLISPDAAGKHHIAVGGDDGAGTIEVASYNLGATVPSWTDLDGTGVGPDATDSVLAMEFSPGFASDFTLALVTETAGTAVFLELYS